MALTSWVDSANISTDFPIENLPLGVFRAGRRARIGVAIGDRILDLCGSFEDGLIQEEACTRDTLNLLMSRGREAARALRERLTELLREGSPDRYRTTKHLLSRKDAEMLLPATIGDYSDFYASIQHATNLGSMFRPDNPLLPNYKWVPIGYHGRASSVIVSGTPLRRPKGQMRDESDDAPSYGPTQRLDYELELGVFIGPGNALGSPISVADAEQHVFGFCLLNDWSARDVQAWEYQPLGPFLAKSFASTISPWVVTAEALEPFRIPPYERSAGDPEPLPHLAGGSGYDITMDVLLRTEKMASPVRISRGNFREMYWTVAQLIAHHTSNGCNLRPGDLLGSGTISGPAKESRGSLVERTWRGSEPLDLPNGEQRRFLQDGDEVILRAYCEREGARRIGFGECRGVVLPSLEA